MAHFVLQAFSFQADWPRPRPQTVKSGRAARAAMLAACPHPDLRKSVAQQATDPDQDHVVRHEYMALPTSTAAHPAFAGQETGKRDFKLTVRKEEYRFAVAMLLLLGRLPWRARRHAGLQWFASKRSSSLTPNSTAIARKPRGCAFIAEREWSRQMACTATLKRGMCITKEWLRESAKTVFGANLHVVSSIRRAGRQDLDRA